MKKQISTITVHYRSPETRTFTYDGGAYDNRSMFKYLKSLGLMGSPFKQLRFIWDGELSCLVVGICNVEMETYNDETHTYFCSEIITNEEYKEHLASSQLTWVNRKGSYYAEVLEQQRNNANL